MLRAIISETAAELSNFNGSLSDTTGEQSISFDESDNKEDVLTFINALEKVESWLFSKIVESLWWQVDFELFSQHLICFSVA